MHMKSIWKLVAIIATTAGVAACDKDPVAVQSVSLDKNEIELAVGATETISATVLPENAEDKTIIWSSSDPSVATVSDGTITGVKFGEATITATAAGISAECVVIVSYGAPAVDLGLSVKWAAFNVGAQSEEESGWYFAWGETSGKSVYNWEKQGDYLWGTNPDFPTGPGLTKYYAGDGLKTLQAGDDPATANWGGKWRTPTIDEINELLDASKCEWTWDSAKKGYTVKGLKTGNTIFLPAAGFRAREDVYRVGLHGYYWSSTIDESDLRYARNFDFGSSEFKADNDYRFFGESVRAVKAN